MAYKYSNFILVHDAAIGYLFCALYQVVMIGSSIKPFIGAGLH